MIFVWWSGQLWRPFVATQSSMEMDKLLKLTSINTFRRPHFPPSVVSRVCPDTSCVCLHCNGFCAGFYGQECTFFIASLTQTYFLQLICGKCPLPGPEYSGHDCMMITCHCCCEFTVWVSAWTYSLTSSEYDIDDLDKRTELTIEWDKRSY